MKTFFSFLCTICAALWLLGCSSVASYPPEPEIKFKELSIGEVRDPYGDLAKMVFLKFSFVDGDGDIGEIKPGIDVSISRIYRTWYKKLPDMTYEKFVFNDGNDEISDEIPWDVVMDKRAAHNKVLKGFIEVALIPPTKDNLKEIDEMRIEFYIVDRAGNESNVEYTPDFSTQELRE